MERSLSVFRVLVLAGLAISAALLAEELRPGAPLCGRTGGCDEVLRSMWARPFGVPLPAAGVAFFATLLGLSLVPGRWPGVTLRVVSGAGGLAALGLILVQMRVLGRICPFCMCVDTLAMCSAVLVQTGTIGTGVPLFGWKRLAGWAAGGLLAPTLGIAVWGAARLRAEPPPPPEILALRHSEKVTIVEIGDIRCRHCRAMHKVLNQVERAFGDRVHRVCFVLCQSDSPGARLAPRALWCARQQGRARPMADSLIESGNATPEFCRDLAAALHLSVPTFTACMSEPAVADEVDREAEWLERASPDGLPAVWIDNRRLDGLHPAPDMRAAILDAERLREYAASR